MVKYGIYSDYDLMANREIDGSFKCVVCEEDLQCRWTDYHGEGVCLTCETPYQLIQYDENKNRIENASPKCNIKEAYIPLLKQYWQEFKRPMGLGTYLGTPPKPDDLKALHLWLKKQPDPEGGQEHGS